MVYEQEAVKVQNDAILFEQKVQEEFQFEQEKILFTYAKTYHIDAIHSYLYGQSIWYYDKTLDIIPNIF